MTAPFTSSHLEDVAFDDRDSSGQCEPSPIQRCISSSNVLLDFGGYLSSLFPTTESDQQFIWGHSVPESSSLSQTQYEYQADHYSNASALAFAHITHIPTAHHPDPFSPSILQKVSVASSTMVDEWQLEGSDLSRNFGTRFYDPTFPSLAPPVPPSQNIPLLHNITQSTATSPFMQHRVTHPDPRSFPPFHSRPAGRGRPARAIEYGGLWMDKAELVRGLMDPDGNISVHRCRWKENRTPCHLWIRGDKSCIKVHIQKWHREKRGGDKLMACCRWSGCNETMLKESIPRHIVSIHLDEKWKCRGCEKEFARNDAYERHAARSNLEVCQWARDLGALITYPADARVVNARAALGGEGSTCGA